MLASHRSPVPSPENYLAETFGDGGYLSRVMKGFVAREGQLELAHAVDKAIRERKPLFAEAGTGTGKSLGYSAPATYYAYAHQKRVVIVTANIALQEQIANKDLPLLASAVPWDFSYASLKGRNNFLCLDKLAKFEEDEVRYGAQKSLFNRDEDRSNESEEKRQLRIVHTWAVECRNNSNFETGDFSELVQLQPSPAVQSRFSVASADCKGNRCKYAKDCFGRAATEAARRSSVIVTNYHMYFAHLSVFLETGIDHVLGPIDIAILDEAHKAPDIARDFFGFKVTNGSIRAIATFVRKVLQNEAVAGEIERASEVMFRIFADLKRNRERYKARLTGLSLNDFERAAWIKTASALQHADSELQSYLVRLEEGRMRGDIDKEEADDREAEASKRRNKIAEIVSGLNTALLDANQNREYVFFLEEDERQRITIASKLVDAGSVLEPGVISKYRGDCEVTDEGVKVPKQGPAVACVATSATLATGSGDFDYFRKEMGADRTPVATLIAASPFNWPEQALFIVPEDIPDPQDDGWRDAVARGIQKAIGFAGGRTLCLHTSRRSLEHTFDTIAAYCRANGIRLMKQGDAPRTRLIETFRTDVTSVLLGLESFWAGVDVPGEACSVVTIDRLPFPTPDDPVLDALSERDKNWFWSYSVPRAQIAFKQGFGRSVRSHACRKVVVCFDNRITKKKYGKEFLRALPNVPKTQDLSAIAEWLKPPAWDEP